MKPITEEQRKALIADCEKDIIMFKRWVENYNFTGAEELLERYSRDLLIRLIALASLTAEPEYNTSGEGGEINLEVSKSEYDKCHPDYRWISYTAPPVQVIDLPNESNLPERDAYYAGKNDGFNECLAKVKRLLNIVD